MMKSRLTVVASMFALCLLAFASARSQGLQFKVKWGEELHASVRTSLDDIIGYDGTGIYTIKSKIRSFGAPSTYTLEHYDNNFAFIKSLELEFEDDGYECEVSQLLQLNGKLYIFYSYRIKKEKKNILFADEIDKQTLTLKKKKIKIGEIDYSGNSHRNSGFFAVRVSRDSSKLLTFYSLPDTKGDPEAFGLHVLDDNLQSIWQKSITLPYKDGLFDFQNFRVDNNGNVYMLGTVYKEKRKAKRHGNPNYTYEAFAYTNNGNEVKQYTLSLEDRFITDMQIEILNNNLVCAGFYSNKGTYSIRGTYVMYVDITTKEVKTKSFKEFGIDFITQNMSNRQAKKAKRNDEKGEEPELYEYDLDKLLIGKDGSAMLIGEQYYVDVSYSTNYINGRTVSQTIYHYYYNDIIAVRIDAAGQIQWAEKIAKQQHTTNDGGFYSSYTMAIVNGKICFLFNDDPDNLNYDGKGRPENYNARKSIVVLVSLDREGKQTKQPVFNTADAEVIVRPKVCEQISNHELILFGQKRKKQQFARMVFN
jgi:hypothetical protein